MTTVLNSTYCIVMTVVLTPKGFSESVVCVSKMHILWNRPCCMMTAVNRTCCIVMTVVLIAKGFSESVVCVC